MQKLFSQMIIIFLLSNNLFAMSIKKDADKNDQVYQVIPFIIGSALITSGVYELGSTVEESQRNVAILWGGEVQLSYRQVLYQSSKDKGIAIAIKPVKQQNLPEIAINYRF